MKIQYYIKNLKLIERNREWLKAKGVPVSKKLGYYPAVLNSYAAMFATKRKKINYLGKPFYFDNPATPLNMQNYPYEISVKVLGHIKTKPKKVLDVGANIGQFARTYLSLVPGASVHSFEPNPEAFAILEQNAVKGLHSYNIGISPKSGTIDFFYQPNRSGIGSVFEQNAGEKDKLQKIKVSLTNNVPAATKQKKFDLVKIDVEGYEFEVVKALKGLEVKYLFVEASTHGRAKNYKDSELLRAISDSLGDFEIVYTSGVSLSSPTYELLLQF